MQLFAIGDLHMPGDAGKTMDIFGDHWRGHLERIAADWDRRVREGDLVLLPGDISWAMRLDGAREDLAWIGERPGTKLMIRGNHDYWWQSIRNVRATLPDSCHAIQNDAWIAPDRSLAVAGTRLWDVPELALGNIFAPTGRVPDEVKPKTPDPARDRKIFERELGRLELSLAAIPGDVTHRIVMLHYPPTNGAMDATAVTGILERHGVALCVFGHLHGLVPGATIDGVREGVRYVLTSADAVGFELVALGEATAVGGRRA
jgi:predicted phosphohydrolase